jgi:non-ribosomal peptide synthase protein (TIGR01720 family)
MTLHLEGHGRETADSGLDLARSVGWFTSLFPVRLDLAGAAAPSAIVAAVRTQLAAVPRRGLGYGVGRWLASPPLWEVSPAELCFNYLGQFDGLVGGDGPFGPAAESVGPQTSPRGERAHLLDVNGLIVGGALKFEWHFSEKIHRGETIARLADRHFFHLRALLAAAVNGSVTAAPPELAADRFALSGASAAELDRAIGEIEF